MNVGKIQFVCAGESGQAQYRQEAERKGQCSSEKKSALLECMSNLTANEMFTKDGMKSEEEVVEKIVSEIQTLSQKLDNLVIVTNNVFDDGVIYDARNNGVFESTWQDQCSTCAPADRWQRSWLEFRWS